jgi:hypothetical protein
MTSTVRTHRESVHPGSPRKSTCRITLTRDNFDHDDAGGFDDDVPLFDDNTVGMIINNSSIFSFLCIGLKNELLSVIM